MSLNNGEKLALSLPKPVDFTNCMKAIEETEKSLSCSKCNQFTKRVIMLWSCDHIFCQDCIEDKDKCPVCSLPAWAEDHTENTTVNNIAKQTELLKRILQEYMAIPKEEEKVKDSVTTCSDIVESVKDLGKAQDTEAGTDNTEKTSKSGLQMAQNDFKVTPVRSFPEPMEDSEETQTTTAVGDSIVDPNPPPIELAMPKTQKQNTDSAKVVLQDVAAAGKFQFAIPSPVRKRALTLSPVTPVPAQKSPGRRTPKTPGQKSPGQRTPKTPRLMKKNKKGETALHIAAMMGKDEDVKSLVEEGADVNAKDNAGWTPLHEACNHGHVETALALLNSGALINVPGYDDETPLMDAARQGHFGLVKLLLDKGADMGLRSCHGLTALDLTTSEKIKEIFEDHQLLTQAATNLDAEFSMRSAPEKIIISFSSKLRTETMKKCMDILGATVNTKDATTGTHYVIPSYADGKSPRTLKYLQAVAQGIWIVKNEWLDECAAAGKWVDESDFEISGSRDDFLIGGPKRSRINRTAKCPAIFHGCHFYLYGFFKPPSLSKLRVSEVLKLAGATMLKREPKPDSDSVQTCTRVPYHANRDQYSYTYYIVYDDKNGKPQRMVRRGKVCTVPLTWALDCISQFYLCEVPQ